MLDKQNSNLQDIPTLDPATASQLLDNVFATCDVPPSSIPMEALEDWGNYNKTNFRFGRMLSYIILVILILLPLMFFRPSIVAQRTNIDSSESAIYDISIKALLFVDGVSATIDGHPITLERKDSRNYIAEIDRNGTLSIQATLFNGQTATKTYDVSHLDTEKPELVESHSQDNLVYLVIRDTYSGVDYENITAVAADQTPVQPFFYDEKEESVVFQAPSQIVTVSVPDHSGNVLVLLLSPVQ